jgi:hypothetical protein
MYEVSTGVQPKTAGVEQSSSENCARPPFTDSDHRLPPEEITLRLGRGGASRPLSAFHDPKEDKTKCPVGPYWIDLRRYTVDGLRDLRKNRKAVLS